MNPLNLPWNTPLFEAFKDRQTQIDPHIRERTKNIVQEGPFKGMNYDISHSWGTGNVTAKLLGFYEEELYPLLEAMDGKSYDCVIDVGCAEGFFAVGLALRMKQATILAHDIDEKALEVTRDLAARNGVQDRVKTGGEVTCRSLQSDLVKYQNALVFCDCEGFEKTLLDPLSVPALIKSDILVECHDFADRTITPTLQKRFENTHNIYVITEQGRNPNRTEHLKHLNAYDKMIALCEFRPEQMHWLWIEKR